MMPRLIEAEELKHILNNSKYYGTKAGNAFADMITECKTIEKQKKGKWIDVAEPSCYGWDLVTQCSACGYKREWGGETFNFCPNCGADMREEEQDG